MAQRILYDQKTPAGIPFNYQVVMGKVPWAYPIVVQGISQAPGASPVMLWADASVEERHDTAEFVNVVSTSNQDGPGGTGLRSYQIKGLDDNFNFIQEIVTMNGIAGVTSSLAFRRVFQAGGIQHGAATGSVGAISVSQSISGELMAAQTAGTNESRKCYFPIPAGYYGLLLQVRVNAAPGDNPAIRINERFFEGIEGSASMGLSAADAQSIYTFQVPLIYPPKTEVFITTAGDPAGGSFEMMLVREDMVNGNHNIFEVEP